MATKKVKIKSKVTASKGRKKLPKAPVVVSLPMNGITFKLKGQAK